jgi:hypothetical protein
MIGLWKAKAFSRISNLGVHKPISVSSAEMLPTLERSINSATRPWTPLEGRKATTAPELFLPR